MDAYTILNNTKEMLPKDSFRNGLKLHQLFGQVRDSKSKTVDLDRQGLLWQNGDTLASHLFYHSSKPQLTSCGKAPR